MTQPTDPIDEIAHQQNQQADREAGRFDEPPRDGHWIVSVAQARKGLAALVRSGGGFWDKEAYDQIRAALAALEASEAEKQRLIDWLTHEWPSWRQIFDEAEAPS